VKLKLRQAGQEDACMAAEESHDVHEGVEQEDCLMEEL